MKTMPNTTPIKAIRDFFEADNGRKISMDEIKALTPEERKELAALICEQTGDTLLASSN